MKDHSEVAQGCGLNDLDSTQLIELGQVLGISYTKLTKMTYCTRLNELVAAWIKREDEVLQKSGEPTLKTLTGKLEEIGQAGIAKDIRKKYAGSEQPENQKVDQSSSTEQDSKKVRGMSMCIQLHAQLYITLEMSILLTILSKGLVLDIYKIT